MRELTVERYLMARAVARGGCAIKHGNAGYPDRIVVLHGKHGWCEVKRPGQRPRPLQDARKRELELAGAFVDSVDSFAKVERFLDRLAAL